jgi:hypothetical protein
VFEHKLHRSVNPPKDTMAEEFELVKPVGNGAFATCFLARRLEDSKDFPPDSSACGVFGLRYPLLLTLAWIQMCTTC